MEFIFHNLPLSDFDNVLAAVFVPTVSIFASRFPIKRTFNKIFHGSLGYVLANS